MNVEDRLNEIEKKLDSNATKIIKNMNKLHSHEEKINDNAEKIKTNSYALDILKDYKKECKRQFVIILVILVMWFMTIGYLVYVLNDVGTVEETTTQEISDVDTIENSNITNGDMYGESKTN